MRLNSLKKTDEIRINKKYEAEQKKLELQIVHENENTLKINKVLNLIQGKESPVPTYQYLTFQEQIKSLGNKKGGKTVRINDGKQEEDEGDVIKEEIDSKLSRSDSDPFI